MAKTKGTSIVESIKIKFDPFERKLIRWLMMAAGRDHTRPGMHFALTVTDDCIFASDGWRLHAIPLLDAFKPFVGQTLKAARPIGELARSMEFEIVLVKKGQRVNLQTAVPQADPTAMMVVDAVALKKAISGYDESVELCLHLPEGDGYYGRYYLEVRSLTGIGQYSLIMGKIIDRQQSNSEGYRPKV